MSLPVFRELTFQNSVINTSEVLRLHVINEVRASSDICYSRCRLLTKLEKPAEGFRWPY